MPVSAAALSALLSVLAIPAVAQVAGDATRGQALAQSTCASCHAIDKGQMESPIERAPAFAKLAALPGMTPTALRVGLRTAHAKMPNLIFGDAEIDDVAAYLATLI